MNVQLPGIKVQLAIAYAMLLILIGCIGFGHCFGTQLHLRGAGGTSSSVRKLEALYQSLLRWALAAPKSTRGASLYLLVAAPSLHDLSIKTAVQYFGALECDKRRFDKVDDA